MLAIDAKNVIKQYKGSQTPALNSISIEVQSDQIFTFLGRNGAGKTTFVRMCATQLMPTSGSIGVLGYDAINCADRVRELITIVPQEGGPLRALTPWDHVYNWLQIRGEYKDEARRRAREMLEKLEL
jgi:ABC-2 type transport system ATP-binding protein